MKMITVRDLRHRWPVAEAALQEEGEIVITRDSKPIARLVPFSTGGATRKRWDPIEHMQWLKKVWGAKVFSDSSEGLSNSRDDRGLIRK